eukprot:s583_g13.t1
MPRGCPGPSDLLRQNFFGGRALHVASISENPEVTRMLLQMRSDPDVATNIGCAVLCFNPQYGTNPGHTQFLLQARANPNISFEPSGNRALSLCDHWMLGSWQASGNQMGKVRNGTASLAEMNLALGNRGTALHFAALNGSLEIAKLLLEHEADPGVTWSERRYTPLQLAQHQGQEALVELLKFAKPKPKKIIPPPEVAPANAPMGNAPMGNAPMGNAPMGNAPMGNAPMGNAPKGAPA